MSITERPEHGATPPDVTHTPTAGFGGEDRFQFTAKDADGMSSTATVRVTVIRAPVAPQVVPLALPSDEDTSVTLRLGATDESGDTATYRVGPEAVAFYKHRAEAELCSTFAHGVPAARAQVLRGDRDLLWDLDLHQGASARAGGRAGP